MSIQIIALLMFLSMAMLLISGRYIFVAVGSIVASSIACTVLLAGRCAVEAGTEPPASSPARDVDEPDVELSHE